MTTESQTLLQLFDVLVAQAGDPERLCREADLPDDALPLVRARLALALTGARRALEGWLPRPPLQDGESGTLGEALADVVTAQVRGVMATVLDERNHATLTARAALLAWNRERDIVKHGDRPSKATLAAMREPKAADNTMERVDLGDGKYRFRYRVKPAPEDVQRM